MSKQVWQKISNNNANNNYLGYKIRDDNLQVKHIKKALAKPIRLNSRRDKELNEDSLESMQGVH